MVVLVAFVDILQTCNGNLWSQLTSKMSWKYLKRLVFMMTVGALIFTPHPFLVYSSLVEHSIVMSPPPFSIPYLDMLHQQLHSRLACRIPPRGFV